MQKTIFIDGNSLTLEQVEKVALENYEVKLTDKAIEKINISRNVIDKLLKTDQVIYGVNTGFGYLKNTAISLEEIETLQRNLIISHSTGVGEHLEKKYVRAMLLFRANALSKGFSGIKLETVKMLLDMLNLDILPLIPSKGSVGASGDLAPLSHMVLPMIGEGNVLHKGQIKNALEVLAENNLKPIVLQAKEGLALINGTQMMASLGTLTLLRAKELIEIADCVASMSLEALIACKNAFREELHIIRNHKGQVHVAKNIMNLLKDSKIIDSNCHCNQVQDAYSLRCIPQVHGAIRDTLEYVEKVLSVEINSVTDNPIVLPETEEVISGGNFHGEPLALALDFLAIALSELGNISERRIERLVNPTLNNNLPPFLAKNSGVNSGFMIAQYTAAALVSENKVLSHPASVDSIPTSGNQEDHVSMGSISAKKVCTILENIENILSIELLCSSQGIDFREPLQPSPKLQSIHNLVREKIPSLIEDRNLSEDILKAKNLIQSKGFVGQIKQIVL